MKSIKGSIALGPSNIIVLRRCIFLPFFKLQSRMYLLSHKMLFFLFFSSYFSHLTYVFEPDRRELSLFMLIMHPIMKSVPVLKIIIY